MDASSFARLHRQVMEHHPTRDPAHDFSHVERVLRTATTIARTEGADLDVVRLAALFHEYVTLPKSHPDSANSGELCALAVEPLLHAEGLDAPLVRGVVDCIRVHAYSRGLLPQSLEAVVLQDADRLDAIGAIGVARCFSTCASMGRPFYHPEDPFCVARPPNDKDFGLDHFFRKLLKIQQGLHTACARKLGARRAAFLERYLEQLREELDGNEPVPLDGRAG